MGLDLTTIAGEVGAITEKAAKEAHQEATISAMQVMWGDIEFCASMHEDTGTPLLKMHDSDMEVCRLDCPLGLPPDRYRVC